MAIEASSHGLDQRRLDGVGGEIGVFTSFSRDHLDYHGDEAAYLAAKARLFGEVMPAGAYALVSATADRAGSILETAGRAGLAAMTYGVGGTALALKSLTPDGLGQVLEIDGMAGARKVKLDHFAPFQAENALAAAGVVMLSGADPLDAVQAIETLDQPQGRMQRAAVTSSGAPIYVDYSHKPAALEAALKALRSQTQGRMTVVFGCGGDRDAGKRPMMGEIASRLADRVIVTDDNPRSEDPAKIRSAILQAAPGAEEIADRAAAIRAAVIDVGASDTVLIAGKGHEQGQIVGNAVLPFDDVNAARIAAGAIRGEGEAV